MVKIEKERDAVRRPFLSSAVVMQSENVQQFFWHRFAVQCGGSLYPGGIVAGSSTPG